MASRAQCGRTFTVAALLLLVGAAGCNPVYSPPVRTTHPGAAGRHQPGKWYVGGAANMYATGGPQLSIPVADLPLHVDVGGDFKATPGPWAMGYAGIRPTYDTRLHEQDEAGEYAEPTPPPESGFALDGELGFGLGAGGESKPEEGPSVSDWQLAYGGYLGIGLAGHISNWFALWMRGRVQLTKADEILMTWWWSGMAGPEFKAGPVLIYLAGGAAGFSNTRDGMANGNAELGITIEID